MNTKNKRNKGLNIKSVGVKLSLFISITLVLILGTKAIYDSVTTYNLAIENSNKILIEKTRKLARTIEGKFKKAYESAAALEAAINGELASNPVGERNRKTLTEVVTQIFLTNPDLSGLGAYFEPNTFDGKDASFVREDNKTGAMVTYVSGKKGELKTNITDYHLGKEWYTVPVESGKTSLIEPYISSAGFLVTTYAMPIIYEGKVIGAINADIDISDLSDKMAEEEGNSENDFTVLLTDKGTIVAHSMAKDKISVNLIKEGNTALQSIIDTAQQNQETATTGVSASTGKNSNKIYIPVVLDGVENNWIFESVANISYFTRNALKNAILNVILSIATIVIIGVIIFIMMKKRVSRPLSLISDAVKKLSEYNLDLNKEKKEAFVRGYLNYNDEIGVAMQSMGALDENLNAIMSNINSHAQSTAATAEELTATAQSTSDAASEVATAVSNIAEGATSQAEDTQSAATSVENSGKLLEDMITTLKKLSEATNVIDTCKNEGHATLRDLISITDKNNQVSENVSRVIYETSASAEKISNASEMIQSISDQTNLLALNAAIEAARAGEAGKGFAVVADEIRKLAEQSAGFTAEIKAVIDELKAKAESAVNMMEDSKKMIAEQTEKVTETRDKFAEISKAVENSKEIVEELDTSSKTIEKENQNITKVVENLSAIAEENAATTEEASASVDTQTQSIQDISGASENLAHIAMELQNEVSKFSF